MENNNSAFFFIDKNIPIYSRITVPIFCLSTTIAAFIIYNLLSGTAIFTLPYTPPPGVYLYRFPVRPDMVITLRHLSVPITYFIAGIFFGIISHLTPLKKSINDLWWGIVSTYLIFTFAIAAFLTIRIIRDELMQRGILAFLSSIIPFAFMIFAVWVLLLLGVLLLLIIPHVCGFMIVAKPKI